MRETFYLLNPWWEGEKPNIGLLREKYLKKLIPGLRARQILILVGSRRCGKTTLIYQLIDYLLKKKTNPKNIFYLLMDHPRVSQKKIEDLLEEMRKIHKIDRKTKIYLFLDEIQYTRNWNQQLKAIYDLENIKIVISGSSSNLLKKESAFLTGRQISYKVHPLDFSEFLLFNAYKIKEIEIYKYQSYLEEYFKIGGYPEYVLEKNNQYLTDLLSNIIYKDIVSVYKIKHPDILNNLLLLLGEHLGQKTSLNKLANTLKISLDTVKEYIGYLKEVYLINEVRKFSYSLKEQIYTEKKYYFSDTGFRSNLVGYKDLGSLAENILFLYLQERYNQVFYFYKDKNEVDFIIKNKGNLIPVEVKYKKDIDLNDKRLKGLKKYIETHPKCKKAFVVSAQKKKEQVSYCQCKIYFLPLWEVLLNKGEKLC